MSFYKFVTQNLSSFNRLVTLENDVFSDFFWYVSNSYTQMHSKTSEAGGGGIKSTPYSILSMKFELKFARLYTYHFFCLLTLQKDEENSVANALGDK